MLVFSLSNRTLTLKKPKLKICFLLKYTIEALLVTGNKLHFNLTTFNYIFKDSKLKISGFF